MANVILLLTDKVDKGTLKLYRQLRHSVSECDELVLLYHQKEEIDEREKLHGLVKYYTFGNELLKSSIYIPLFNTFIPGSNHFPLLDFFRKNADYDFYWLLENDVRFSGSWSYFFSVFSKYAECDFISSHIRTYSEEPGWYWWNSLSSRTGSPVLEKLIRSFNPIYRISGAGLRFIDECLQCGWRGHHEILLPTLLWHSGYKVMDFGGNGSFVPPQLINKFYTDDEVCPSGSLTGSGTMRFRPVWKRVGHVPNKLYHPVKFAPRDNETKKT